MPPTSVTAQTLMAIEEPSSRAEILTPLNQGAYRTDIEQFEAPFIELQVHGA